MITFDINTTNSEAKLAAEVWLDDKLTVAVDHVTELIPVSVAVGDDDGDHELRIVLKNKTVNDTVVDLEGNIVQDSCLTVDNFKFDDIAADKEDSNNNQQQKLEINNNTPLEVNYKSYKFIINIENGSVRNNWMPLEGINDDGYHLMSLNGSHPFFFPFVRGNSSFLGKLIRFSVALAIAEISSADTSVNGKISPSQIRIKMNEILEELSKDVEDN
jgi:hypothetical protein